MWFDIYEFIIIWLICIRMQNSKVELSLNTIIKLLKDKGTWTIFSLSILILVYKLHFLNIHVQVLLFFLKFSFDLQEYNVKEVLFSKNFYQVTYLYTNDVNMYILGEVLFLKKSPSDGLCPTEFCPFFLRFFKPTSWIKEDLRAKQPT